MTATARIGSIFRREFAAYFASPLAGIFLVIYLFMSAIFARAPARPGCHVARGSCRDPPTGVPVR